MCKGAYPCEDAMCRGAQFLVTPPAFSSSTTSTNMGPVEEKGIRAEYELGKVMGQGMFSHVRRATHKLTGTPVAIKILNTMAEGRETLDAEIRAMKLTKGHPNVVNLFEVVEEPEEFTTYMVLEYCEQDNLDQYLNRFGAVTERLARKWIRQLVDALKHCNTNRVVHLDVKPANIYITDDGSIKLGDFGLAHIALNAYTEKIRRVSGSPVYAAPEVYKSATEGTPYLGPPATMWAVGVTLHAMLTCKLPWQPAEYDADHWGNYTPPDKVTEECKGFLRGLLEVDPEKRLTEEQALAHPWLNGVCGCHSFERTQSMECMLRQRMCELGFPAKVADSAARSNAVMDPAVATFSMLQSKLAHQHRPIGKVPSVTDFMRRIPSDVNMVNMAAGLRRVPSDVKLKVIG